MKLQKKLKQYEGQIIECDDCGHKLKIKSSGALCSKCNALYTLEQCIDLLLTSKDTLYVDIKSKEDKRERRIAS